MSIRLKFGLAVALLTACTVLLVTFSSAYLLRIELEANARYRLTGELDKEIVRILSLLDDARTDLRTMAEAPTMRAVATALATDEDEAGLDLIERQFLNFAQHHSYVMQLRLLDLRGVERARIDDGLGEMAIRPRGSLQDKSARDYYLKARTLPPDGIYISPITLNREHGVIERPWRTTLRLVTPVTGSNGAAAGYVVLNMRADRLIKGPGMADYTPIVADQDGFFLRHPDMTALYGAELGHDHRLQTSGHGEIDWTDLPQSGTALVDLGLTVAEPTVLGFRKIHYSALSPEVFWLFILEQPTSLAFAELRDFLRTYLVIGLGLVPVAGLVAFALGTVMARRLLRLAGKAQALAQGDLSARMGEAGSDEVGRLAAIFDTMARRLGDLIEQERATALRLQVANAELTRTNNDLGQFAYVTAHDLRTPLRALGTLPVWMDEALRTLPDVPETVGRHLAQMRAQVRRMETLLSDLLAYASIGCPTGPSVQVVRPRDIIAKVLALEPPPPGFEVEIAVTDLPIKAAPDEFETLLRNLVGNAVAHHDRDQGRIIIGCDTRLDGFTLTVADDGPGILPRHHDKIYRIFQSLNRRRGDSNGIGLALVKKIVDRWGGRIELRYTEGERGATFIIEVGYGPSIAPDSCQPDAPTSMPAPQGLIDAPAA